MTRRRDKAIDLNEPPRSEQRYDSLSHACLISTMTGNFSSFCMHQLQLLQCFLSKYQLPFKAT